MKKKKKVTRPAARQNANTDRPLVLIVENVRKRLLEMDSERLILCFDTDSCDTFFLDVSIARKGQEPIDGDVVYVKTNDVIVVPVLKAVVDSPS